MRELEYDLAGERGLDDASGIIREVKVFGAVGLAMQGQSVAGAHAKRPGVEHLALGVEDEDVILLVGGDQEESSVGRLHHLMAVFDGVLGLVGLAPEFVDAVAELAVPDDGAVIRRRGAGLREQARGRQRGEAGGEEGTSGEGRHEDKMRDERWMIKDVRWKMADG